MAIKMQNQTVLPNNVIASLKMSCKTRRAKNTILTEKPIINKQVPTLEKIKTATIEEEK